MMRVNKRIATTVAGAVAAAGTVTGVAFAVSAATTEPSSDVVTLVGSDGPGTEPAPAETSSSPAPDTTTAATLPAVETTVNAPAQDRDGQSAAETAAEPVQTSAPAKKARTVTGMTNTSGGAAETAAPEPETTATGEQPAPGPAPAPSGPVELPPLETEVTPPAQDRGALPPISD